MAELTAKIEQLIKWHIYERDNAEDRDAEHHHDTAVGVLETALAALSSASAIGTPRAYIEHHKGGDNLVWEPIKRGTEMGYTPLYVAPASSAPEERLPPSDNLEMVPAYPTEEMLVAARDWSTSMYGKPIGNDAARGCWQAMLAASSLRPQRVP